MSQRIASRSKRIPSLGIQVGVSPVLYGRDDEAMGGQVVADLAVGEPGAAHAVGEDNQRPLRS